MAESPIWMLLIWSRLTVICTPSESMLTDVAFISVMVPVSTFPFARVTLSAWSWFNKPVPSTTKDIKAVL